MINLYRKTALILSFVLLPVTVQNCRGPEIQRGAKDPTQTPPFVWHNATIYFLLTDRFQNGDSSNDVNFNRTRETAKLRGFEGGDLKGIIEKLEEGYFDALGVNAIWFSPVFEQIHGMVDEGTGDTYGYHGYWTKDWTRLDPNFGTESDLEKLVEAAHRHGIRVILDVVLNHTGPVTEKDPVWPREWVRTSPRCNFQDYKSTITCTLVENLPDIRTESDDPVELPTFLLEKWNNEGRMESELSELENFFDSTGYPRASKYYIMKWITDLIRDYGVDGFRVDTTKHVEESVWLELRKQVDRAFSEWKAMHPDEGVDDRPFYLLGEVYNYGISTPLNFDFGDRKVNYFDFGYSSLINFEFKADAELHYEQVFSKYSNFLNNELKNYGVVNYISSHDDGGPFDRFREKPIEAGTKLLLCPGTVQIYYGDETARSLDIPGTRGDAALRSNMNWHELSENMVKNGHAVGNILTHWQKIGRFRSAHPAVGAGVHRMISQEPYLFSRIFQDGDYEDRVLIGLDLKTGKRSLEVHGLFEDGTPLREYYSGQVVRVRNGQISLETSSGIALLGRDQ